MYRLKKFIVNRKKNRLYAALLICNWKQSYRIHAVKSREMELCIDDMPVNMFRFHENGDINSLVIYKKFSCIASYIWYADGRKEAAFYDANHDIKHVMLNTSDKLVFVRNGNCIIDVILHKL